MTPMSAALNTPYRAFANVIASCQFSLGNRSPQLANLGYLLFRQLRCWIARAVVVRRILRLSEPCVECVSHVLAGRHPFQVAGGIVQAITIFVVRFLSGQRRSYKGGCDQTMNGKAAYPPVLRESNASVVVPTWSQDTALVNTTAPPATPDIPHVLTAYPKALACKPLAHYAPQPTDSSNAIFAELVPGVDVGRDALNAAKIADLIPAFIADYGSPFFRGIGRLFLHWKALLSGVTRRAVYSAPSPSIIPKRGVVS
ncbi:hypothetical protein LCGC14_1820420 [marine sediment metagenome]|uniref:Uncharacterized protein n=1 Tax=marine sediment metagenome TaxID=412755 RepID=A0A0F9JIP3_9ZZZZ